jgi:hypothetical protein
MHAEIREPAHSRGPFWLDCAILAFSLLTIVWVAFLR